MFIHILLIGEIIMRSVINTFFVIIILALLSSCAHAPIKSADLGPEYLLLAKDFPSAVYIKDHRQTFNSLFYFILDKNGRIWIKPIRKNKETKDFIQGWQLFGSGLPEDDDNKNFVRPERIISIHADADEIMAVSDQYRHYSMRWLPNPVFPGSPRTWVDVHGWPVEGPMIWNDRVKNNRGWGIGRRNQLVKYFEDIDGKSFTGGGGLTTYYFLTRDGNEIAFSDSGLPPDFSHTMSLPYRGTFIAEGFDVSASTMFIIDKHGEMFTRMADFDTNGSDIMFFEYTFDRTNKKKNFISVPSEQWLAHSKIPLSGKARISTLITILTTGTGNKSRELRVAGYDKDGKPGYYYKPIFNQDKNSPVRKEIKEWKFQQVPELVIDTTQLLDPKKTAGTIPSPRAKNRDVSLHGEVLIDGQRIQLSAVFTDFNLHCSPATLKISSDDDSVDLVFHTVEEWYHLTRLDPGRDGTPLHLLGTLEIPDAALKTESAQLREALKKYFMPYNLKTSAFWVEATEKYVTITTKLKPDNASELGLAFVREGTNYPSLNAVRRDTLYSNGFMKMAMSDTLKISAPLKSLKEKDIPLLEEKISLNEQILNTLKAAYERPIRDDEKTPYYVTNQGFDSLRFVGALLGGAAIWAPYFKTLCKTMPALIMKNNELKQTFLLISGEDYDRADGIISTRIKAYKLRIDELKILKPEKKWIYYESLAEYWSHIKFNSQEIKMADTQNHTVIHNWKVKVDDSGITGTSSGSILMELSYNSSGDRGKLIFRITPKQFEKDFFEESLTGNDPGISEVKSFTTPVKILLEYTDNTEISRRVLGRILLTSEEKQNEAILSTLSVANGKYDLKLGFLHGTWNIKKVK
jgi:hypothetical protein